MDVSKSRGSGQGLLRSPSSPPESPLPSVAIEVKTKVDKLIEQIESISLLEDTNSLRAQDTFRSWLNEACTDNETLKYAIERFHQYWLNTRSAVMKVGAFICANYMFEVGGLKLRQDLLICVQRDFESKQEMQAKSPEKFLNAAAFLVDIYTRIRIEKLPLAFMATPVFQYLEDLLDGDDSEIELFTHLIIGVGPTLREVQESEGKGTSLVSFSPLQNLFAKVRAVLISRNLSSQSRLWLLFITDVSSSGEFNPPSSSLQEFYRHKDRLGVSADSLLKSLLDELYPSKSSDRAGISSPPLAETVVTDKIAEIKISPKPQEKSADKAKRSTGRNDFSDKRDNFRSAFQVESKGNKGKSYWLHDDRFDKEDTPVRERNSGGPSKPRVSQSNWKQSQVDSDGNRKGIDGDWRRPQTNRNQRDSKGENWNERGGESSWRQQSQEDRPSKGSLTQTVDLLAANGHQEEESWD